MVALFYSLCYIHPVRDRGMLRALAASNGIHFAT